MPCTVKEKLLTLSPRFWIWFRIEPAFASIGLAYKPPWGTGGTVKGWSPEKGCVLVARTGSAKLSLFLLFWHIYALFCWEDEAR